MKKATKVVAAVGVVASVLAAGAGFGMAGEGLSYSEAAIQDTETQFVPGRGMSLEIGGKHAVGYFETKNAACHLTLVLASADGAEIGDSPGTRFVVPVLPGRGLQIDAANGKSAEFFCGPGAAKMNARVFDRAPYKS
jgi:hypothetical protein